MFAFIHLLGAWLLGKGYEHFRKTQLSHTAWFFLLFGAILPDVDFLFDWTLETEFHRTFTHSLLFLLLAPLLLYVIYNYMLNKFKVNQHKSRLKSKAGSMMESRLHSLALGAGILSHLLLDMIVGHGVPLFWPSLLHFTFTHIAYFNPAAPSFLHGNPETLQKVLKLAIIDMALGTTWLFYLWYRKKLRF